MADVIFRQCGIQLRQEFDRLQSLLLIVDDKTDHAMVDNFSHAARRNAMTAVRHEIKTDRSLAAEWGFFLWK
jgi:hypothetical protein